MFRLHNAPVERLQERLRRGDPAAGDVGLSAGERQAIRERLANAEILSPVGSRRLRWRPVLAVGLGLFVVVVLWTRPASRPAAPRTDVVSPSPTQQPQAGAGHRTSPAPAPGDDGIRQIYIVTKSGTQVIWLLDPGFSL